MIELIGIFKLYRFMVVESIHFHILPRLNWLIWHESHTSLVRSHDILPRQDLGSPGSSNISHVGDPRSQGSLDTVAVTGSKISKTTWRNENTISKTPQNPRSLILGIHDPGSVWDLGRCLPGSLLQRHRNFCKPSSCAIFSPLRQFCRAACRTVCFWPQKPQPIATLWRHAPLWLFCLFRHPDDRRSAANRGALW